MSVLSCEGFKAGGQNLIKNDKITLKSSPSQTTSNTITLPPVMADDSIVLTSTLPSMANIPKLDQTNTFTSVNNFTDLNAINFKLGNSQMINEIRTELSNGLSDEAILTEKAAVRYTQAMYLEGQRASQDFAKNEDSKILTSSKIYADSQDVIIYNNAKTYSDTQDGVKLVESKNYSDSQDIITLNNAKDYSKAYSDAGDLKTLESAKTFSTNGDTTTLDLSKQYSKEYTDNELLKYVSKKPIYNYPQGYLLSSVANIENVYTFVKESAFANRQEPHRNFFIDEILTDGFGCVKYSLGNFCVGGHYYAWDAGSIRQFYFNWTDKIMFIEFNAVYTFQIETVPISGYSMGYCHYKCILKQYQGGDPIIKVIANEGEGSLTPFCAKGDLGTENTIIRFGMRNYETTPVTARVFFDVTVIISRY